MASWFEDHTTPTSAFLGNTNWVHRRAGEFLSGPTGRCYTDVYNSHQHLRETRTETPLSDAKHEETFRVVDRRMFNAEGEVRDEAREERRREEARGTTPPPASAPAKPNAAAPATPAERVQETPQAAPAQATQPAANEPKASRGLEMLINFVAQNAAMLLGAYPDPRTGQGMVDLEGAREMIDMLDALHEATRGNIASEDQRLLLDVAGSLKLSFMELTKAAAKAMQEKAKARP